MQNILIVFIVIGAISCAYVGVILLLSFKTDKFQKSCSLYDFCYFYNGEDKTRGRITAVFGDILIVEDEDGDAHQVSRFKIYPCPKFKKRW